MTDTVNTKHEGDHGDVVEVVAAAPEESSAVAVRPSKTPAYKKRRLAQLEARIRTNIDIIHSRGYEAGAFLAEIDEDKLYQHTTEFPTFDAYCEARFGFSRQHAYRLIRAARAIDLAKEIDSTVDLRNEAQARPLTRLLRDPEKFEEAVHLLAKGDGPLTSRTTEEAVKSVAPATSTERDETKYQQELRERLPEGVEVVRWEKGTLATIRLDLRRYIKAFKQQSPRSNPEAEPHRPQPGSNG